MKRRRIYRSDGKKCKRGGFCANKNPVIDALLMSKRAIASKEMIQVEMTANLTAELLIRDYDLTIMLGNLYDNAVDACRKNRKRQAVWNSDSACEHTVLILMIVFKNPVAKNQSENRDWKSTKSDGNLHGYGIKNIDKTVALYDGYCSRTIENGVFQLPDTNAKSKIKLMEVENVLEFIVHCNLCQIRIHSCLNQKENK
mgnify:CR=1 FL=1